MGLRLLVNTRGVGLAAYAMRQDLRRYQDAIKPKLKEAGEVVKEKQRDLLQGSSITQRTGNVRRYSKKKGKFAREKQRSSRLLGAHRVVIKVRAGGDWEVFVGPTPGGPGYYGKFLELGVASRRTKDGAYRGSVRAVPWMRPALEATEDRVEQILADTFKEFRMVGR